MAGRSSLVALLALALGASLARATTPPSLAKAVAVAVASTTRTPAIEGPVLDLAIVDENRFLVLSPRAVALYRTDSGALTPLSRLILPGLAGAVRSPAGLIASTDGPDWWVLTNSSAGAVLVTLERDRVVSRLEAVALPWPGVSGGLRYRSGTNQIEGTVPVLGPGPFVAVRPGLAVAEDGELRLASTEPEPTRGPRTGSALDRLWPGFIVASSPTPPGAPDALLLLAYEDGEIRLLDTLPVEGTVTALAARASGQDARLIAAIEEEAKGTHLLISQLSRRKP